MRFIVAEQLAAVGVEAEIALEPMRRDSAAAVAVAACLAERRGPGTVALVVAADHFISDMDAFASACVAAAQGARAGYVMTLGVAPTAPATGYGYIHPGSPSRARARPASSASSRSPTPRRRQPTSGRVTCGTAATSCSAPT